MDLYEKKFTEMQKYIPFLEAMIERLKKVKDKSREPQLQKMQSLHGILSKSNGKKLTIEKLDRCEELLLKLHNRVDKGTASISNIQTNKSSEETKPNITGILETEAASSVDTEKDSEMYRKKVTKDQTPASPSPPASPDQVSQPKINLKPIIIPTERSDGYTGTTMDDRPASPDECEMVASVGLRQPVIIPTEPMDVKPKFNPLRKTDPDSANNKLPRWNFSAGGNQPAMPKKSNLWQSDKPPGLISTMGGNTSSKTAAEARPRILRHIPTVPTPSKGASLIRKPVLVLDKKNSQASGSETESPTSKWESPISSVSDSDSHHQRTIQMSPKSKELPPLPKLPATPLLVSPPPVLTMPPLTTEDLAELLSDDGDSKTGKKPETGKENLKKGVPERHGDEIRRLEKDTDGKIGASTSKDGKVSKNYALTQDDIESDRRWEEEYKHIVKMPSRRIFTSPSGTPAKHSELKFPPAPPPVPQIDRPTDPRKRPPSPIAKERDPPPPEPRYADNYEKHPRPPRDLHSHNSISEHNQMNSAFPRIPDGDPNNSIQNDDRNSGHYQRRPYGPAAMHDQSSDPRREKSEYYNRMMIQQEREMQQNVNNRAPMHHSPGRSSDPCNQSQWGQNSNYPPAPQGPNMQYQQQQRPDMWTMKAGASNVPMEPHMMGDPAYMRQGQYPTAPNNCRGPMMSPQDMNHGPCMDPGFRDEIPNQSMVPSHIPQMVPPPHASGMPAMMQPQGYQIGNQYRGFPPENRPNVQQFDRPQEFPHPRQSWEQPVNRPPENIPYPRQPAPGQWNRPNRGGPPSVGPSTPPSASAVPINRDRPYNDRGRGPEPSRPPSFNRDPRTRTDAPAQQQNSPTGQTGIRRDHVPPPPQNANNLTAASNARRDPRFAKETTQTPAGKPKDHAQTNDRNARRSSETKSKHISSKDVRKSNEKSRSQHSKNEKKDRRESENDNKNVEKSSKDVMQSPLESLYGVIDTAAKTGKGYGLQKFKIPKIKRPEPVPSPPRIVDEVVEENWDLPEESSAQSDAVTANDRVVDVSNAVAPPASNRKELDDKKAEVTSTTGESVEESRVAKETVVQPSDDSVQKETPVQSTVESEAVDTSTKSAETIPAKAKESDPASLLENLLEAKFFEKFNELLNSKKLKEQFKKFIGSDSSGGSDKDNEETESKKVASKKKRRMIVSSDSSEEECLAERLSMIDTSDKDKSEATDSRVDEAINEETGVSGAKANNGEAVNQESSANNAIELSNDTLRDTREAPSKKGKPFRRKKREQKVKSGALTKELQQLVDEVQSVAETNEPADEKPAALKEPPVKTKTKRRNSLEMLQEDVREMFISDEVVTATGFRSCRLQKEDHTQLNSSVENLTALNSKKKGSTTSLDRLVTKMESDMDEVIPEQRPASTRGRGTRTRSRKRPKSRAKLRQSVKEIISSDSETEDSAQVDLSLQNDTTTEADKASDESLRSDAVEEAAKNKDESEETHFLRRSERVGLRESMKEPRIHIQKTEVGKIDSSKIMFDSSSDESFGIDVSELTAAVDISLHPEPQISPSPVGKRVAKSAASKKRMSGRRRGNVAKTIEEKSENIASGDEVDSIASDMSRASSLTRGKKAVVVMGKLDTNEELLSDILTGLVDPKAPRDAEKDGQGAATPTVDVKANTRKKKKKKPSWQMGILKKKKKKLQSPVTTPIVETEKLVVPNAELESSFEIPESKVDPTDFANSSETGNPEVEPKAEELSDTSVPKTTENYVDNVTAAPFVAQKEEPCSPVKGNLSAVTQETKLEEAVDEKKPLDELLDDNKSDIELNAEGGPNFNVRKLMSYVWSTRKDRFKCMFCPWIGKNIVHHYTLGHPGKEMMISRLSIPESKRAIGRAMVENYDKRTPKSVKKETRKFTCRFCAYTTEGSPSTALEAFYEHCTTHTGEYRFRCNCCPYQTVARSSMKTHYYRRACRNKYHGNMSLAICEDPVPDDDFLYGYICTKCNFVQLKESNVQKHVKTVHDKIPHVDIVRIDMSSFVDKDLYNSAISSDDARVTELVELETMDKDPLADTEDNVSATTALNATGTMVDSDPLEIVDEALKNETESGKSAEQSEAEPTSSQEGGSDGPPVAGNLSAFVCPPELENKEDEIQHERRKKMQEVVDNIGISNKSSEKRDLSIIDKLKDKMTTNMDESLEKAEAMQEVDAAQASVKAPTMGLPVLVPESVTSLAVAESNSKESQPVDSFGEKSREVVEAEMKPEPTDSGDQVPELPHDEAETDTEDKSEKKPKDPLANLEESRKDDSSDGEDSDRDTAPEQPRSYESDSTDQSDAEITADMNSLLEETYSINAASNAPMMTTIQRLAAKLQGEKSMPVSGGEGSEAAEGFSEQEPSEKVIPKPPNAIPISSIQRFLGRRNAMLQEVAKEVCQAVDEAQLRPMPASPPKKFIRLRRLSGDKLSVPGPSPEPPADSPAEVSRPPSVNESAQEITAEIVDTLLDPEDEESCSFLRIENVVSLAPGADNNPNETMINDIRKAVANSPKTPIGVSVLKKSSPNILKRPAPVTTRSVQLPVVPVQSVSPQLPMQNVKLVKVIKGRTLLKQKDGTHRIFGCHLKNPENFAEMIKPEKLRRFYKCMARTCSFTTDSLQSFESHYRYHKETVDRTTMLLTSYDFQRCAYCTETLTTWNAMSEHLKDKHIYCQYQCSYCFYRALAQSYVELHQMSVHQGSKTAVLLGVPESPPIEVIDRREFVIPFVCHHECGKSFYVPGAFLAHLRTKHGNSLSIFKCHLCPAPLFKAEQLVGHYKLHGIYKYQCLYCVFGSEQSSDVHAHLSASHYNRPPHILERTLQPRPVRDKDVIQQLVVLNVDEGYKCTELTLVSGQNIADIPKNKHWLQVDRNTNDGSAVGVVTLPIGNIGMNRLFPYEKLDSVDAAKSPEATSTVCNPATPIITKFRKVSPKKSPENILIVDDSGEIRKMAKISNPVAVEPAAKDSSAKDPLVTTDAPPPLVRIDGDAVNLNHNLHCDEEFLNFNILDDPGFLNAAGDTQTGSGSSTAKPAALEDTNDKNEDSDIEILEDIEVSSNKSTTTAVKTVAPELPEEQKETSNDEKAAEANTTDVEPVIVCSSPENSLDLNLNVNSTAEEAEESFERPLTLSDIKHTGFIGRDLYRCGYEMCDFGAETAALLRTHIKECIFATDSKTLNCFHCNKRFVKSGFLLEHFKLHGPKRFGCSMCKNRWTQPYQAMAHMKMKHRQTYSKLIPADPKNPSADGLFVVEPIPSNGERSRGKKRGRAKSTESDKIVDSQKVSYGPTEIEALPRQPIYQQEVHCAVCPYRNKVRTNLIRHLQLHAKDESVPESGPVNPVPCLDKSERMFDKMVNLASSSHQNGRMGGTKSKETTTDNAELLPKFIPENKRYVCGVTECNYLSIDEGMLRTHVKALHPEELYFRCPHCPAQVPGHEAQNIPIDKMGIHLKMHDNRLYKCSHCNHHHYHRHVVERHLSDKHPEANPFVKVIREIENTENPPQQTAQEAEESSSDLDGNHWKCNVCDYKCIYKPLMAAHAALNHEEKSQFKCTVCPYKSNNKITFDQHVNAKHATDPNADYTMVYEKIKGTGPRRPAEAGEAGGLDEPFDTTPLWRRDMPRIRHIRGILFEDEDPSQPESPAKSGKRKSDAQIITRPVKIKPGKSVNDALSNDKDNDSWNGTLLSDTSMTADDFLLDAESLGPTSVKVDTSRLTGKFGPYGSPITHFWRCTICQCFKTKYKHDMRDHLYRDLKYFRYRCTVCGYSGVSKNSVLKHFMKNHENRRPTEEEQEALPVDEDLETWVNTLLKSQTAQMRGMIVDEDGNIIGEAKPKKANVLIARRSMTESPSKPNTTNITQAPLNDTSLLAQTVDLTQAISEMQNKTMDVDAEIGMQDDEDEDSNDNDALVIDNKDDGLEEDAPDNVATIDDCEPIVDPERLLVCKHCNMKFERMRGFKLHVQIRHLRRLNYLCPYCDTSSNSEKLMRRHLRLKHANLPEQVDQNPVKSLPELTNEFWEKEYGLVLPEKPKKRKRTGEDLGQDPFDKTSRTAHVCGTCGFRAINFFGLGVHMRVHATVKNYKCSYCTFAASEKSELWQHSEQNHAHLDWRVGNGDAPLADTSEPSKNDSSSIDRTVEDYAEYVAAEASASSAAAGDSKSEVMYMCFYCNTSRKTIEGLKEHWKTIHKNTTKTPGDNTGMPFRYKEITANPEKKILRCGYCPKRGLAATIRLHSRKKHPSKAVKFVEIPMPSENWICQWCGESVDSEAKKKVHQNMFHSHLPPSFGRPQNNTETPGTVTELEARTCPKCPFKTTSVATMQKHVAKHVDSVRCKRCDKTFPDVTIAILHNTQAHPGEVSAIEGFTTNVEKIMSRFNWRTNENSSKTAAETVPRSALENWRTYGVAKKSTTKSAVVPVIPSPSDFRAVARKSTNPLPRYPPGIRFSTDDVGPPESTNGAVSYYGVPRAPVNLNNINTYITLGGGRQMKLNCTTLAQLIDMEPHVLVKDIKRDFNNSALFPIDRS